MRSIKYMNRLSVILLLHIIILTQVACGNNRAEKPDTKSVSEETIDIETTSTEPGNGNSILIAYFSVPESDGVDALAGASRVVEDGTVYGNTQWIAHRIQEETGGTLFAIETVQNYPGNHEALVDQADTEKSQNARPELSMHIGTIDEYEVVFIGYPIWWAELPMPLYSFLEKYDFRGKTIIPFSSHGGSGFADTIATLTELEPDAEVLENGFTVSRQSVQNSKEEIIAWLNELDY